MSKTANAKLNQLSELTVQSYTSFDQATNEILRGLSDLIGVRSTFLARVDSEIFHVIASFDQGGCAIPVDAQAPASDSFCQFVIRSGQPVVINNANRDPRVMFLPTKTRFNIGSYIGVPVQLSTGELFGTLCAVDPDPHRFSKTELKSLTVVAHILALYVERHLAEVVAQQQLIKLQEVTAQLEAANAALEAMNQYKSDFLAAMPHEIRTPLTSMIGYTTLLQSGMTGQLSEAQRESVDCISRNAQRLVMLINDVLETSQLHAGHIELAPAEFELRPLIMDVVEFAGQSAAAKALRIEVHLAENLPHSILNDPRRIRQMLVNLLNHAIQVTPSGMIKLDIDIEDCQQLAIEIRDRGPQLPTSAEHTLWHPFQQVEGMTPHTALSNGLPIVRQLAEQMGGSVRHRSHADGNTMHLSLPITIATPHTTKQHLFPRA